MEHGQLYTSWPIPKLMKLMEKIIKTSKFDWMPNNIRTEKTISIPILASKALIWDKIFLEDSGKLMMQTWENGKNPNFRPNFGTAKFFSWVLPLLVRHSAQNNILNPGSHPDQIIPLFSSHFKFQAVSWYMWLQWDLNPQPLSS